MKKYRIRKGSIADTTCKAGKVMCVSLAVAGLIFFSGCQTDGAIEPSSEGEIVEVTMDFKSYDVPLAKELQLYIYNLCEEYGVDPALVIAMIGVESSYNADAIGDGGDSVGLMQVQEKWHGERMARLGASDLTNPYENVTVGIDILAEKIRDYDTIGEALTVYNAGDVGGYELYFSKGIYANEYAEKVILEWVRLVEQESLSKSVKISEDLQL